MKKPSHIWSRLLGGFFKDTRSAWQQTQERKFIEAVNKLKNFSVSERGGLSIDPEELRAHVLESREKLKHHVHQAHRRSSGVTETSPPQMIQTPDARSPLGLIQTVTWRCHNADAVTRYVCLQSLDGLAFAVALTDVFNDHTGPGLLQAPELRLARIIALGNAAALRWFSSLQAAIDAHDASGS